MALPRIFVIDDSEAVRETVSIVLENSCEVRELSPIDCTASFPIPEAHPDLLIVNGDNPPAALLHAIALSDRPVIWLRTDVNLGPPVAHALRPPVVLPYRFEAHQLRERVQELLHQAPLTLPRHAPNKLAYPYLSREAALVAREAASQRLPVLVRGEPGTGRARVAAALHTNTVSSRFVAITPQNCTRAAVINLASGGSHVTLFVDDVATATADAEALLLELAEAGGIATAYGWLDVQLITGTAADLGGLANSGRISRDLYYRLSVLPITLTPLRDRSEDIPALARAIAADLCSTLRCQPVAFTPRALQRLSRYLWFGNTAELETVLARTITLAHKEVIDVGDLLFGYGPLVPAQTLAAAAGPAESKMQPRSPLASHAVDMIINELAHEFKNPLVTLKTFAQHLDRLVQEESSRYQLVLLPGEAVDRIDRALENLLQFTRFHEPASQPAPLGSLLSPILAGLGPLLSERKLVLDYRPTHANVLVNVDAEQVSYAFENLLRALVRSMKDGSALSVTCTEGGGVTIGLPSGGGRDVLAQLRNLLSSREPDDEPAVPLGIALARSLIVRNGGQFDFHEGATESTVVIRLPGAEEMGRGSREYRTTASPDRR